MASIFDIYVIRDRAKRYSALTTDYANWARNVKAYVHNAGEEDWGTYIAAFSLLESIIPTDVRFTIEQQAEYEKRRQSLLENAKKKRFAAQRTCMIVGASFSLLAFVLLASSDHLLFGRLLERSSAFSTYGLALFAIIGGASAGFAIGTRAEKPEQLNRGLKNLWACMAGIACAFACPLLPPISLIMAWLAWHAYTSSKDASLIEANHKQEHAQTHKQRVFSQDPHAPVFVKRALRLAGIYQTSPDPIGRIARAALLQPQSDYGSFVVYEAILGNWHAKQSDVAEAVQEEGTSASSLNQDGSSQNLNESSHSIIRIGTITGFLTFLLVCILANHHLTQAIVSASPSNSALLITIFVACLFGAIIGWRSAKRIETTVGLSDKEKRITATLRCAWFAAWPALFGILIIRTLFFGFI